MIAVWNSRLPASRRCPFSAATEPSPATTRCRRRRRSSAPARSRTVPGASSVSTATYAGSRERLRGAAGGAARSARQYTAVRGTMHPTSDTMSSR